MTDISNLLLQVCSLSKDSSNSHEESFRYTLSGASLTQTQCSLINHIIKLFETVFTSSSPSLIINDSPFDIEDDLGSFGTGKSWRLILPKREIATYLRESEDTQTFFFFSEMGLCQWLNQIDPFRQISSYDPFFDAPLTIRVYGLEKGYGGATLSVLPALSREESLQKTDLALPDSAEVGAIVSTTGEDRDIRISPKGWSLTWGDTSAPSAEIITRLSCLVLGASLASEIKCTEEEFTLTLRGSKKYKLPLWNSNSLLNWKSLHQQLVAAVSWVYHERPETKMQLLLDRLTLDLNPGECFLACLYHHIENALKQAKDSYSFVVLERKDAYYKEMREAMKDMRSQADHYANKTREIITFLTRDYLGVFLLLAILVVRQLNLSDITPTALPSPSLLVLRALAIYLIISFLLQLAYQLRDSSLLYKESESWLNILSNYTNQQEKEQYFLQPIKKRKSTLTIALCISGVLYTLLALGIWFFPKVLEFSLSQWQST